MRRSTALRIGVPELFFSELAATDLRGIRSYIAENDPNAAVRFVGDLVTLCHKLAELPRLGSERPDISPGVRSIPHRGGNYMIYYRLGDRGVEILRVLHVARNAASIFGKS